MRLRCPNSNKQTRQARRVPVHKSWEQPATNEPRSCSTVWPLTWHGQPSKQAAHQFHWPLAWDAGRWFGREPDARQDGH